MSKNAGRIGTAVPTIAACPSPPNIAVVVGDPNVLEVSSADFGAADSPGSSGAPATCGGFEGTVFDSRKMSPQAREPPMATKVKVPTIMFMNFLLSIIDDTSKVLLNLRLPAGDSLLICLCSADACTRGL